MHDHRIAAPERSTREHAVQRLVLLELLTDPPDEGDLLIAVANRLRYPVKSVTEAVAALEAAGLAVRSGSRVRASASARYFESLWPIAI